MREIWLERCCLDSRYPAIHVGPLKRAHSPEQPMTTAGTRIVHGRTNGTRNWSIFQPPSIGRTIVVRIEWRTVRLSARGSDETIVGADEAEWRQ